VAKKASESKKTKGKLSIKAVVVAETVKELPIIQAIFEATDYPSKEHESSYTVPEPIPVQKLMNLTKRPKKQKKKPGFGKYGGGKAADADTVEEEPSFKLEICRSTLTKSAAAQKIRDPPTQIKKGKAKTEKS